MNINENIIEFEDYVQKTGYNETDLSVNKYYHSIRVCSYAKLIAKSFQLNEEDIYIASLSALLHDLGRFKDYEKTKEVQDHGDESYRILKEDNYIYTYTTDSEVANIVLTACKYHSKFELPSSLDKRTKLFCDIVRDADKLDIIFEQLKEIPDGLVSPNIINSIRKKEMCKNKDVQNKLDELVRHMAFIFDLQFIESFKLIKEKNIISELIINLKNHTHQKEVEEIEEIIKQYIEERC